MNLRKTLIVLAFGLFLLQIPVAGFTLLHIGVGCQPGPCMLPVWWWPLVYAPSGVAFAGLALVLRDMLQRLAGVKIAILAVIIGTGLSYFLVDSQVAMAGSSAYFLSEMTDTLFYSWISRFNLLLAVLVSSCAGIVVDSLVFLHLAFNSYTLIAGQLIGKLWMVVLSLPLIALSRKYLAKL